MESSGRSLILNEIGYVVQKEFYGSILEYETGVCREFEICRDQGGCLKVFRRERVRIRDKEVVVVVVGKGGADFIEIVV